MVIEATAYSTGEHRLHGGLPQEGRCGEAIEQQLGGSLGAGRRSSGNAREPGPANRRDLIACEPVGRLIRDEPGRP